MGICYSVASRLASRLLKTEIFFSSCMQEEVTMIRLFYNRRAPLDNIRTLSVFRDGKNMGIELRITL